MLGWETYLQEIELVFVLLFLVRALLLKALQTRALYDLNFALLSASTHTSASLLLSHYLRPHTRHPISAYASV